MCVEGGAGHARTLVVKPGNTLYKTAGMLPHGPKKGLGSEDRLRFGR